YVSGRARGAGGGWRGARGAGCGGFGSSRHGTWRARAGSGGSRDGLGSGRAGFGGSRDGRGSGRGGFGGSRDASGSGRGAVEQSNRSARGSLMRRAARERASGAGAELPLARIGGREAPAEPALARVKRAALPRCPQGLGRAGEGFGGASWARIETSRAAAKSGDGSAGGRRRPKMTFLGPRI